MTSKQTKVILDKHLTKEEQLVLLDTLSRYKTKRMKRVLSRLEPILGIMYCLGPVFISMYMKTWMWLVLYVVWWVPLGVVMLYQFNKIVNEDADAIMEERRSR